MSATTTNIKITQPTVGGDTNTWGTLCNANFLTLDNIFGNETALSTTSGNDTLSDAEELVGGFVHTGTLSGNVTYTFSGRGGFWWFYNGGTDGIYTVTCLVSGQTGVVIPEGHRRLIYCDGTDIEIVSDNTANANEATVASATTTDVLAEVSPFINITGTTTITSLGTGTNSVKYVRFAGILTLTHNATSLILPGAENITTAAGDTMIITSDSSSNVRVRTYQHAVKTAHQDFWNVPGKDQAETISGVYTFSAVPVIGVDGGGDAQMSFYDDTNDAVRTFEWDDTASQFQIENSSGTMSGVMTKALGIDDFDNVTVSTSAATGGSSGDWWFQREA